MQETCQLSFRLRIVIILAPSNQLLKRGLIRTGDMLFSLLFLSKTIRGRFCHIRLWQLDFWREAV